MMKDSIIQCALSGVIVVLSLTGCNQPRLEDAGMVAPEIDTTRAFQLKPEVNLDALQKSDRVDVNLGHAPEIFIQALWKQFTGELAAAELVERYAGKFGSRALPRRIDLAITLAEEAGVRPQWVYSDPWQEQAALEPSSGKVLTRDIGAVLMFFFTSPDAPNGGPGWANNHVPGMHEPDPAYQFEHPSHDTHKAGFYHPANAGFWYREMKDARHAGLDFALLNVYGPDLEAAQMEPLRTALERLGEENGENVVKLGMFDDTWTWGQPWFGPFWEQKPDCLDVEATAQLLYEAKWQPFFKAVPRDHWYLVNNRPMIYFYNSNTLQNRENFDRVLPVMKTLFKRDFGIDPWVAVDTAFNYRPLMKEVSDSHFKWYTFDLPGNHASETRNGITLTHSMVRWDPISRGNSRVERAARPDDLLAKDDAILKRVLNGTRESDILVLATWNDLGEGTGINRCYDYYWDGEWKQPNHFMDLIRRSQAGEVFDLPGQ
ncbi:MAG: DUF5010 domain-containing protein [Planctomycetaceae bacterium]|nr:DUF5010 domain-containing protein [Planctomycetaceae bacterium]